MRIEEIKNKDDIKQILMTEGIRDEIGYDGKEFEIPDDFIYLAGYDGNDMFGLCIYHDYRDSSIIHMNIKPGYRGKHSHNFGKACLELGPKTIYAEIPDDYPNVIGYAKSF